MKLKLLKKLFLTISFILTLSAFSQNQNISTVTKQIYPPQEICSLDPTNEGNGLRVLRNSLAQGRTNINSNPCSSFNILYDAAFNLNDEAREAFDFAANIWANLLESSVQITIDANLLSFPPDQNLVIGSAANGGFFQVAGQPTNTVYQSPLAEKLLGSEITNSDGNSIDITININQNFNFYYGIDPDGIAFDETDFITIIVHEIGHGLGMSGLSRANATLGALRTGDDQFSAYDSFLNLDRGSFFGLTPLLQQPSSPGGSDGFEDPSPELRAAFVGSSIVTNSPRAVDANNGESPDIFAPPTYAGGSSINHLDETVFNFTDNALMTPSASANEVVRDPGPIVLGLFQDMGWSLCRNSLSTEDDVLSEFVIAPNPFSEKITIKLPEGIESNRYTITIVDINGRLVLDNDNAIYTNGEIIISNLSSLTNSLYFLNISDSKYGNSITKKILKE